MKIIKTTKNDITEEVYLKAYVLLRKYVGALDPIRHFRALSNNNWASYVNISFAVLEEIESENKKNKNNKL